MKKDIYELVTTEETAFQTTPVPITDNWEFHLPEHIKTTVSYKNSKFTTGVNDGNRPNKNITRPILNMQYRAEGFDLKDITLFIEQEEEYYKSFLLKKYHEKWARENDVDKAIDDSNETKVDFGGVIMMKVRGSLPEVRKWESIAFCDQTNFLSGPFAFKQSYSFSELKDMEKKGWGNKANGATMTIDDLIVLCDELDETGKETPQTDKKKSRTSGKYVETYEVYGSFPKTWLQKDGGEDIEYKENDYVEQMHIIAFYKDDEDKKQGVTLFKSKENIKKKFKIFNRDEIFGRCIGLGGGEELFDPQVWTNYDVIRIKNMLDVAGRIVLQTSDSAFRRKNVLTGPNGEILVHKEGQPVTQLNNVPTNITAFESSIRQWQDNAQMIASASDPALGNEPKSGTPFKLQELVTREGHSIHDYRRGKFAKFWEEIYRDWILPDLTEAITQDQKFLSELSPDELQAVVENVVICKANEYIKEQILSGNEIDEDEKQAIKDKTREQFLKDGSKKFLQILKDELKGLPVGIGIDIAGKQKYLASMTDKIVNVFSFLIQNPQVREDSGMMKTLNEILEYSGLSPMDFAYKKPEAQQIPQNSQQMQRAQPMTNAQPMQPMNQ